MNSGALHIALRAVGAILVVYSAYMIWTTDPATMPMFGQWTMFCVWRILSLSMGALMVARGVALTNARHRQKTVAVIVLGDVGHSPRMSNHALSLAAAGWQVELIGYVHTPPEVVLGNPRITVVPVPKPWPIPRHPKPLYLACIIPAALGRACSLLWALCKGGRKGVLLVQNPPSIPTLAIARFAAWFFHGAALIVDWHNFGYTIMETTNAPKLAVKVARWYEQKFGPMADAHFCVAEAMAIFLKSAFKIPNAHVLYDKPPKHFGPTSESSRKALYHRLEKQGVMKVSEFYDEKGMLRDDRPALLVSSTSWTPDEDFMMLKDALLMLEKGSEGRGATPCRLHVIITGKGPDKARFEQEIKEANMSNITVHTVWLPLEDYPLLLGAADIGVCLHYSSSGYDLPMKVVDMFGCGLPVCAIHYNCIDELVADGQNGYIFRDSAKLADVIVEMLQGFTDPAADQTLARMRHNLIAFREHRWEQEWVERAEPVFNQFVNTAHGSAPAVKSRQPGRAKSE